VRGLTLRLALVSLLPMTGGCLYIAFPQDIHQGPGAHFRLCDAETRLPVPDARVLIEQYRIEGAMHTAPVVVLEHLDVLTPSPKTGYQLERCVRWQQTWVVWMPVVRHSPVRRVVGLKVYAPGYETVWFNVRGPLIGLDLGEEEGEPTLYLRALTTAAEREAAINEIARHGWPPGPRTAVADVVIEPAVRATLAPLLIERYQRLLADFPDYPHADRVRLTIERWQKAVD
jgi:hypothetical protein